MILKETVCKEDIKSILCHIEIYDTITDDNNTINIDLYEPEISEEYLYVGGYLNNKIIALMIYHDYLDGNECHVHVLPEFRKEYAKEFGEQVLNYRGHSPLYAEIPLLYKNVLDFALLNKFNVIEIKNDGYIKGGKEYPVYVLKYEG